MITVPLAVDVAALKDTTLLNMGIFGLFVAVTMVIVFRASKNNKTAADYYAAGRSFTGSQNGTAIAGDYLSAASFLGITGAIAINGYDGFMYSIGFLVAWLVALLLVAELLRNTGKFTMADVLSFRLKQRPVRIAAAISTLAVCFFYLLAQMAGAGSLISLLLGISDWGGQALVIIVVGALMIMYVLIGGMKGTTWVQIIKAILLIAGAAVMTLWVLPSTASTSPPSWARRWRPPTTRPSSIRACSTARATPPSWTLCRSAWRWSWARQPFPTC